MKVAFVVQAFHRRGGTERCMVELAGALRARGHSLAVFAHSVEPSLRHVAPWYRVPMLRWPSLPRYLSYLVGNTLVRATLACRRQRFDIIHSTGPDVLHPTVTTLHCCAGAVADVLERDRNGSDWRRWRGVRRFHNIWSYRIIAIFERYVLRHGARHVIAVSHALASDLERHNGPLGARLTVVPNGVNLQEFHPPPAARRAASREALGVSPAQPVVLFVGYNWERKGVAPLVSALATLAQDFHSAPAILVLVGSRGHPAHERSIRERLAGRVRFLGPRDDLAALYGAADVCVLPSVQESFGLPILEAMACGLPVVVSRCAGVAELITDGVDGLLLDDPRDATELAAKLALLLDSADLRQGMGARARATAERYSWAEIARRVEQVYFQMLTSNAGSALHDATL